MYFDKRIIYIIIIAMIARTLVGYMTDTSALISLIITIPAVLIAITFHEFAHAFVADKLGDDTPRSQGRLTLNPIAHLDPVGSFLLLFAGFGWGKPVQVNPRNYTRKMSMEVGDALVSIAGPIMNFLLAIIFTLIYCGIYKFNSAFLLTQAGNITQIFLVTTISINIGLGVFNLLPLPPLDGSKVIMPLLPSNIKRFFIEKEQIFYIIFVVIWIFGIASYIISPAIKIISNGILNLGLLIFGL